MNYELVGLFALIVVTAIISTRYHSRSWPGRPGYQYQRVISLAVFGGWLTVAGAIGWDLKYVRGFLQGTKWVDPPIWWQIGVGVPLLALAVFFACRIPSNAVRTSDRAMTRMQP
jgi:hypothetical protein